MEEVPLVGSDAELWYVSYSLYSPLEASNRKPFVASSSSSSLNGPTVVQRSVALPAAAASFVGMRHSRTFSAGVK